LKDWDQPWKKKEPGGRLNDKQRNLQEKSAQERMDMSQKATQHVKIVFFKTKLWKMSHFHGIGLEFSIPMRKEEIRDRIHQAFPELGIEWEEAQK